MESINKGIINNIKPLSIDPGSDRVIEFQIEIESNSNILKGESTSTDILGNEINILKSQKKRTIDFEIYFSPIKDGIEKSTESYKKIIFQKGEYPEIFGKIIGEESITIYQNGDKLETGYHFVNCSNIIRIDAFEVFNVGDYIHAFGVFRFKILKLYE